MIELKNLHIGYIQRKQPHLVFKNINALFLPGYLIGLAGNNGVGKSTLLKTIAGMIEPLKGNVLVNNKSLSSFSNHELSKIISIVSTEKIGGFNLKAFDVVAAGRIPYLNAFAHLNNEDIDIVNDCFNQIGINDIKHKLMDELSDGQKQKIMIAKALAQQTSVILLDEPTAFLDYTSRHQLYVILKQLCVEQNKTIIVSSHDLELLFSNSDNVLCLKNDGDFLFEPPSFDLKSVFV